MKKIMFFLFCLASTQVNATGMAGADPVIFKGMLNHLEYVEDNEGENSIHWDAEAWLGKDINKLWFKTEGERHEGEIEAHRIQLLYNRAVLPYWDVQLGVAHDTKPSPSENGLVLGVHGTAPYYVDTEIELYLGEEGHSRLEMSFAQEWMLTQRLALEPEIDITASGKEAEEYGIGSGLNQLEASLRLHYEIRREFAPYIGLSSHRYFSDTKKLRNDKGGDSFMIGLSAWF